MSADRTRYVSALSMRQLAGSLLLLLIALAVAGGVAFAALQYGTRAERSLTQALAEQAESSHRLARVQQEEEAILARIDRYRSLVASGRIQPERRLDWVNTLQRIRDQRRLLSLDYEFAPQQALQTNLASSGGYRFYVSPMQLEVLLLHEEDLLGLLDDLQAQVAPLVIVRRCTLERLAVAPEAQPTAQLRAHCAIDWMTLQEEQ